MTDNKESLYKFPDAVDPDDEANYEQSVPTTEETELFKGQVAEWLKLDDQIRKLNLAIRERRIHQRVLSGRVQQFMIKYKYDNLNTNQGIIKSNVREVKQPLKLNDVKSKLEDILSNDMATVNFKEAIMKIFEDERPTVTKQSLHRRIPKVSMSLEL